MATLDEDVSDDADTEEVNCDADVGWVLGGPWGGFGWIFPLISLLFLVVMAFMCFRMMGGCIAGHSQQTTGEVEELRREVRELREEVQKLRQRG